MLALRRVVADVKLNIRGSKSGCGTKEHDRLLPRNMFDKKASHAKHPSIRLPKNRNKIRYRV